MKFTHGIRYTLITAFLVILMCSTVLIGVVSFRTSQKIISESIDIELGQIADKVASEVEEMNMAEFKLLHGIAALPQMRSNDFTLEEKNIFSNNVASIDRNRYADVTTFNTRSGTYMGDMYMEFDAPHVSSALKGVDYVSPPAPIPENFFLCYGVPVYDYENKINGVVASIVFGEYLTTIVSNLSAGGKYKPVIVDRSNGVIIGHESTDVIMSAMPVSEHQFGQNKTALDNLLSGNAGTSTYIDENGQKMICAYAPVGESCSWSVICASSYDSYYRPLKMYRIQLAIIIVIIFSIGFGISLFLINYKLRPLAALSKNITEIGSGNADLSKRIPKKTQSEVGDVIVGFNNFTEKLQNIMKDLKVSKEDLVSAGSELEVSTGNTQSSIHDILDAISQVNKQIKEQSGSVTSTVTSVDEITENINSLERMIEEHSQGVTDAGNAINELMVHINEVSENMDKIASSFQELLKYADEGSRLQIDVNEKIEQIKGQSETLQEANAVIASIAEQTNLLAMNAAIEAAHAGEAGKGFSVVADEIRKLSETSSEESRTIGTHLTNIHVSIDNVVEASGKSSSAFSIVTSMITETDALVSKIKHSIDEQNSGSRKIGVALNKMNDSTLEVRNAGREMSVGNQTILKEIKNLEDNTSFMNQYVNEMTRNAERINENGSVLGKISGRLKNSIDSIGNQIDQFKV